MTDPIADLLTRVRNAHRAGHAEVAIPFSRIKLELLKVLYQEGYIAGYKLKGDEGRKSIEVTLRYVGKRETVFSELKRVSRPGRRVYVGYGEIPVIQNGLGVAILSTSRGILTDRQAREEKVGGELLCAVW